MRRWFGWLIVLWMPLTAAGNDRLDNDYLRELLTVARTKGLAERTEWRTLLHYKPRFLFPGVESQADDSSFFNAHDGKTNPQAELDATLAVFFSTLPETDKQQNPQCRFIARYQWLKHELGFDPARLPPQPCKRFYDWRGTLNPQAVTLVFPAAYLNNPASLYGHTLLRVDARGQDERTRLLAYSISYAAATTETNGLAFAVKGLFGGYPGLFSISPYYAKVTEYNDLENRDIWEYELNFTSDEIDRMLMHVWELGPIRFDYYFFDENCAYHLLSLFEAGRPSLRLTDRFPFWAIPADTVRAVTEGSGLVRDVKYRPARSTVLRYRQQQTPESHIRLARAVALGPSEEDRQALAALTDEERARVLEVAFEYLDYERLRGRPPLGDKTAGRLHELLLARSRLDVAGADAPPVPVVRPDEGHRSARVALAAGRDTGRSFQELRLRPVYHDLLDPQEGYGRGAEIEFVDVVLRRYQGDDDVRIQSVDIIDIVSMSARDELLKPLSWKLNLGYARKRLRPDLEPLMPHVKGGAGFAFGTGTGALWYGMLEGELNVNRHLEHGYAVGAGPGVGVLVDPTARWRVQLEARALAYAGDAHSAGELILNQRFTLGRQSAVRVELMRRREFDQPTRVAALSWSLYF